jgi:tRNA-specific 2-thiouridylase
VVKIDKGSNSLVAGERKEVLGRKFEAKELHLLSCESLPKRLEVNTKIRYNHPEANAVVYPLRKGRVCVEFRTPQWAITPGQSAVFYKGDNVVGGATIDKVKEN